MPFVRIRCRRYFSGEEEPLFRRTSKEIRSWLAAVKKLPRIIAEELSCDDENGSLTPGDVGVESVEMGSEDISHYNFELHVEAMKLPTRSADIQERSQRIFNRLVKVLEGRLKKAHLWLKLVDAVFVDEVSI